MATTIRGTTKEPTVIRSQMANSPPIWPRILWLMNFTEQRNVLKLTYVVCIAETFVM